MIVVIDLEATCWEERPHDNQMEIIEIGAIKVDLHKGEIVDRYQSFIRPTTSRELSDFCKRLTTITQDDVNRAGYFWEVYPGFTKWFGSPNKNLLASWGNYDKNQIMKDCQLHRLKYHFGDQHWNAKRMFAERFGLKKELGLSAALEFLGMEFKGTPHRAISDAENTARLLIRVFNERTV